MIVMLVFFFYFEYLFHDLFDYAELIELLVIVQFWRADSTGERSEHSARAKTLKYY